jgi:putative transposase
MPYDNLRIGRYSETNRIYFVTTVINNRNDCIFSNFSTARLVVNEMRYLHETEKANSIAWVIMPDHLHWLFQLKEQDSLPNIVKTLKARSAQNINKHLNRTGAVWQKAYYDHALRKEEDIKGISRYIVANPLRAGLVKNIGDYPLWDAIWL